MLYFGSASYDCDYLLIAVAHSGIMNIIAEGVLQSN